MMLLFSRLISPAFSSIHPHMGVIIWQTTAFLWFKLNITHKSLPIAKAKHLPNTHYQSLFYKVFKFHLWFHVHTNFPFLSFFIYIYFLISSHYFMEKVLLHICLRDSKKKATCVKEPYTMHIRQFFKQSLAYLFCYHTTFNLVCCKAFSLFYFDSHYLYFFG